ncbi:hypothetical protein [Saccharomonospora iraqiensis]|uniref:hypothetical protein n=1 Tax=Saccharomonospora iraqiensis TaxID=52698 RepID=UPI00022E15DB|nr:hypothetical protein [Saccharomonospora iraqiensis]
MSTSHTRDPAELAAQQLAAVVIAALRPDTASDDRGPDPRMIGLAVRRLGDEFGALLRGFESATDERAVDSAVDRAARLATHIMLSGQPHADRTTDGTRVHVTDAV